jgi:hypothetical protein
MIDTTAELIAGYTVAAILYGGYGVSLWLRARRVRRRLDAILAAASSRRARTSGPSRRSG